MLTANKIIFVIKAHDGPAIKDLLRNCQSYKEEFPAGKLDGAIQEYYQLLMKAKETGWRVNWIFLLK